eukprot:SAG31_NODE_2970_length_4839_cov_2.684810_3_plen_56_part_00
MGPQNEKDNGGRKGLHELEPQISNHEGEGTMPLENVEEIIPLQNVDESDAPSYPW